MAANPKLLINGYVLQYPQVGIGTYARRLLSGLERHAPGLEYQVYVPENVQPADLGVPADRCLAVPSPRVPAVSVLPTLFWHWQVTRMAVKHQPSAVFHSPAPIWSPCHPANLVVTLHDALYRRFPSYLGGWPRRTYMRGTEHFADRGRLILTDSMHSQNDLRELAGICHAPIQILPCWVDPAFDPVFARARVADVRQKYRLPPRFWLYLGGFDVRKNVGLLLRAMAAIQDMPDVPPLVLAGRIPRQTGPAVLDVRRLIASAGLSEETVRLIGEVKEKDLAALYGAAELFIYPSLGEGFGLPPAEAMAVGTPVLVTDTSSLPEVVPRAGCRFDPTRDGDLVSKLRSALGNVSQFRCELPASCREEPAIREYLRLLEPLLPSTGSPART